MQYPAAIDEGARFTLTVFYPGTTGSYAVRFPSADMPTATVYAKRFVDRMVLPVGTKAQLASADDLVIHLLLHL